MSKLSWKKYCFQSIRCSFSHYNVYLILSLRMRITEKLSNTLITVTFMTLNDCLSNFLSSHLPRSRTPAYRTGFATFPLQRLLHYYGFRWLPTVCCYYGKWAACERPLLLKARTLSANLSAPFTGTFSNAWTSSNLADLSVFPGLICGFCSLGQRFAYSFLQTPPHDGRPCHSAIRFLVAWAHSGLSPVRAHPLRANKKRRVLQTLQYALLKLLRLFVSR